MAFRFVQPGDRLRPVVEAHVKQVYGRTYGATLRSFPRRMVADIDETGAIRCAAGLRCADDGFFSECYVDGPLELALSRLAGTGIGRDRLIEVTSLASCSVCASVALIDNIIEFARLVGTDWAVFTITPRLKKMLCRINLPIVVLGAADRTRVANPDDWGRYYDTQPLVAAMRDPGPAGLLLKRATACAPGTGGRAGGVLEPAHG